MQNDVRRFDPNSPKASPRGGSRSPAVIRSDSTGTLRTTITLGKNPSVIPVGPFYLLKEPPCKSSDLTEKTGSTNLMVHYGLEHSFNKFSGKKLREELSAFMPNLPGNIDTPGNIDNSSLRSLIDRPPITGKEINPLNGAALTGFRLHPGPLPEQYRMTNQGPPKRKHKHKKSQKDQLKDGSIPEGLDGAESYERKHKKQKRTDEDREKRKKKKEKKKKKGSLD